jgi:hypothetical protein
VSRSWNYISTYLQEAKGEVITVIVPNSSPKLAQRRSACQHGLPRRALVTKPGTVIIEVPYQIEN